MTSYGDIGWFIAIFAPGVIVGIALCLIAYDCVKYTRKTKRPMYWDEKDGTKW